MIQFTISVLTGSLGEQQPEVTIFIESKGLWLFVWENFHTSWYVILCYLSLFPHGIWTFFVPLCSIAPSRAVLDWALNQHSILWRGACLRVEPYIAVVQTWIAFRSYIDLSNFVNTPHLHFPGFQLLLYIWTHVCMYITFLFKV